MGGDKSKKKMGGDYSQKRKWMGITVKKENKASDNNFQVTSISRTLSK